ncbi:MAG: hypothetical protein IPJ34_43975 [Myxococcales bacterium]|nr:hypothetical protein [Myxococcales bacterium]
MLSPEVSRRSDVGDSPPTVAANILRALPTGVLALDARTRVVSCNPFAGEVLGVDPAAVAGAALESFFVPLAELRLRAGPDGRGEIPHVRPDGRRTTLGFALAPLPIVGAADGAVVLVQDIATLEDLRNQRDRLLQMAAVSEVLPTMLHELRNPLAAVSTTLELLVEEVDGRIQQDLHSVLGEVRRLTLSLQGIGGGHARIRSKRCQAIDEAIEEAVQVLKATAARRGIELSASVAVMPLLPLSREVIRGVVFNLVRNSIDACGEGDAIEVRAHQLESGELELLVADSGMGMEPHLLARCTELFFTNKQQGSGIGLALCHQIAERGRGRLIVESRPEGGTTVTLRVPTDMEE